MPLFCFSLPPQICNIVGFIFPLSSELSEDPMSLSLLQGYSSAEEEEEEKETVSNGTNYQNSLDDDINDGDSDGGEASVDAHPSLCDRSMFDLPQPSATPRLPFAFDAFSEDSGPPQFLNNSMDEYNPSKEVDQ